MQRVFFTVILFVVLANCSEPSSSWADASSARTFAVQSVPERFVLHPSIPAWLEKGGQVAADSPFTFGKPRPFGVKRLEFQASHFTRTGTALVWCGVSLRSGSSVADVWFQLSYGGRPVSKPMVARQKVTAAFWVGGKPSGEVTLDTASGNVLNGQSAPPVYCTYDFAAHTLAAPAQVAAFSTTSRVPRDANQTGGHWAYFGLDTVSGLTLEKARAEFYPIAGYGGVFYKADGTLVTEKDYPKAVLQNGYHWHKSTPTWIRYSDPRNPWKDKATLRGPDGQHWSVYNGPCLALKKWPWDLGLRRLVQARGSTYLFYLPGTSKGTFQWRPGQARQRGRVLMFAVYFTEAMEATGQLKTWLARAVARRGAQHLQNQIVEVVKLLRQGDRMPWPNFEQRDEPKRPDKISPAEMGIWYWGLHEATGFYKRIGEPVPPSLDLLRAMVAQFVFDCYFVEGGEVQLPYYVTEAWDHPRRRSGGRHFGWLAAHHARPTDKRKAELVAAHGETLEKRWKGR